LIRSQATIGGSPTRYNTARTGRAAVPIVGRIRYRKKFARYADPLMYKRIPKIRGMKPDL
jgi:hypothetical protein